MSFCMSLYLHILSVLAVAEGLRTHGQAPAPAKEGVGDSISKDVTFDDFMRSFGRDYKAGSEEYVRRATIFQESLSQIHAINSHADGSWIAGVHPFMDWTGVERSTRLHGYDRSAAPRASEATPFAALQKSVVAAVDERAYGGEDDSFEADAPQVQDQDLFGHCASCWAFAAVEAVEAQLMKTDSPLLPVGHPRLSVQALLDCMPKRKSCRGGCQGSTPELAFDFMQHVGVPLEANLPYSPLSGGKCSIEPYPSDWVRVSISGWRALPRNQAQSLMRTLVEDGPVVVTADAHDWHPYRSGVFDGCPRDATPNHSLLARGYGAEGSRKYWLLQNSWGTKWGEEGAIRLLRHDDEHHWCGIDSRTQEGVECNSEEHRNVTVCGMCGLLYDPVIPQVGLVTLGSDDVQEASEADDLGLRSDDVQEAELQDEFEKADADEDAAVDSLAADSGTDDVQEMELHDVIQEADTDEGGVADIDPLFARARQLRASNLTLRHRPSVDPLQRAEEVQRVEVQNVLVDSDVDAQDTEAAHDATLPDADSTAAAEGEAFDSFGMESDPDLIEAFHMFDLDSSGFVSAAELRHVLGDVGTRLTIEEVDGMIHDADMDGDDRISYEEFMKMMVAK